MKNSLSVSKNKKKENLPAYLLRCHVTPADVQHSAFTSPSIRPFSLSLLVLCLLPAAQRDNLKQELIRTQNVKSLLFLLAVF